MRRIPAALVLPRLLYLDGTASAQTVPTRVVDPKPVVVITYSDLQPLALAMMAAL